MDDTLTLIEKTAFLKSVDVLSSIPTEALAQLAGKTQEVYLDPGQVLIHEGEPNKGTFLVVSGLLELRRGGALVRVLRERMAFGEIFLEHDEPHQYTGVATEPSHVLLLQIQDVLDAMLDFPEFGVSLARTLALRIHVLTQRVLELERLLNEFHSTLRKAGIEPPSAPEPTVLDTRLRAKESDLVG